MFFQIMKPLLRKMNPEVSGTPERRAGVRDSLRSESCARGKDLGRGSKIKDAAQGLIKANQDAVRVC